MNSKLKYLLRSAANYTSPVVCTNCGGRNVIKIDQKYFFTRLFECQHCHLLFRHPSDSLAFNEKFYQAEYKQDDGITTDLPSVDKLQQMINSNFSKSPKNAEHVIELWRSIFPRLNEIKAIDYGCSWGYMTYQFLKNGTQVQGFEISRQRAEYGNQNLALDIKTNTNDLPPGNDLFYSSHVIEHVPSISDMINEAKRLLKPDGFFVAECPNGSSAYRRKNRRGFHLGWGLVHPNCLNEKFYQHVFKENPYYIGSSPYNLEMIHQWDGQAQLTQDVSGGQLLVIAKPNSMSK